MNPRVLFLCTPQGISHRGPCLAGLLTSRRKHIHAFRVFQVGGLGLGSVHHLTQSFRVIQKRTRPEHIPVEGLALSILRTRVLVRLGRVVS